MRISRADRSRLTEWWFTVDHALLAAILALMAAGVVLSLAASPAVALKKGLPMFHFVERQLVFSLAGLAIMLAVSLLTPLGVRRLALALFVAALAGLVAVHVTGAEFNGARRWLSVAGYSLQPSEFAKPAFVVLAAWLFAEARVRSDVPALPLATLLAIVLAGLLVTQPDVGQTLLVGATWGALYVLSGQPLVGAVLLAAAGATGAGASYWMLDHVRARVDRFLSPTPGDNSQIDRAIQSFAEGGFLGRGPGEGTIKSTLPDAHTDFIFAVVAEEYGAIACLALLALFAFIVLRALLAARREPDAATRLAVQGLALVFGLQALINMAVNVGLVPAKGMTLPFISAGGSSTLAVAITLGMLLALTQRRPDPARLKKPRLVATLGGPEIKGTQRP
jgi:cell division protein FtsW